MKARCLFNKPFIGTVTAWSLPKVCETKRARESTIQTGSPGIFGSHGVLLEIAIGAARSQIFFLMFKLGEGHND